MLLKNFSHIHSTFYSRGVIFFFTLNCIHQTDNTNSLRDLVTPLIHRLQRGSKEDLIGLSNSPSTHTTGNPSQINLTNKTFTEYFLHTGNKAEEQWKVGMNLTDLQSENDIEDSYKKVLGQELYLNNSSD